jgi:hypothetical protein
LDHVTIPQPANAGPATVAALARSSINGQVTDTHKWLVNVTLLSE